MKMELIVKDEARNDIVKAHKYYAKITQVLGDDFVNAVDEVFEKIQQAPELHAIVFDAIRKVKLRRFPYVVSYLFEADKVIVLAVLHGHRDPNEWQRRTKGP